MTDLAILLDSMTSEQRAGALLALDATSEPMTARQIEHALRDEHGLPRSRATILASTLKTHRIVAIMGGAKWPYNTARWQRLRKLKLSTGPLCEGCAAIGRLTPANTVDHRHAISDGGDAFPALDGLASYCPACHSAKTARGAEAGAIRSTKPRKSCDENGNPLDALHPWNGGH